jgi:hypothetical protein
MRFRTIVIHSLDDARMASKAAREFGTGVVLHSAPGAAANLGPLWFRQIVAEVEVEFPDLAIDAVFDCGDAPGHALAALRQGLRHIRYAGPAASRQKIVEIARRSGARVETGSVPPAFDPRDHADPAAACRAWLGGETADSPAR